MAIFNPSPGQPNDPNYLNYPRVLAGPELVGDTSKGQTIKAIGDTISDVTGLVDAGIKKGIQNDVYAKVDKERDAFTSDLQKVKSDLDNGLIAPAVRGGVATPASTGKSLIMDASQDEPEIPDGLASGLSRIQQLAAAKAAGSAKINDTQYAAQTLSIAKQLRSQYGQGYREYIDDTVSKASGLPVANSYYQNLMLDINRQLMQIGKGKDDAGNLMTKNLDVPNMGVYINQRASNDPKYPGDAKVIEKIANWQNLQSQIKVDAAKRAESKDDRETQVTTQTQNLTKNLNNLVSHHIEDNLQLSGVPDLRSLLNYFSEAQAGTRQTTDAEVQQRAMQLTAYRNYLYQEGHKIARDPSEVIGGKAADDAVNTALAPIDTYIKLVNDKDTGAALFHLNQNKAIKEDDTNRWLVDKDNGASTRQLMTARGVLGEQYFPDYLRSMIASGVDKPYADLFNQEALKAVAPVYDQRGQLIPELSGKPRTIVDAIQHAKSLKNQDGTPAMPAEYYGKITGWLEKMADPNLPAAAKDNMVRWAFSKPGVTDELNMEYRDPKTNQVVPGKYRALNLMTSDGIVKSVAETAKIHPDNYKMLQGWTETEYGKLFRSDLGSLNKIMEKPYLNAHFSYDDTTKQFGLVDNKNRPIVYNPRATGIENPNAIYLNNMVDILDRVNSGTQSLRRVYEHNPQGEQSVDKHILQTLQTAGFRPGESISGAPAEMAKALIKTIKPEATPEEINKLLLGQ